MERHIIRRSQKGMFAECEAICFASKNIYNRATYMIRKDYEDNKSYDVLNNLYSVMQNENCYKQLPAKVAQQTLRMVKATWASFFALLKAKQEGRYHENVNIPHFLHKEKGRYVARYSIQSISKKVFDKTHKVKLSGTGIEVLTKVKNLSDIACVRLVPQKERYAVEIVYNVPDVEKLKNNRTYAAIDLGVNNLATVVSNKKDFQPFIVNGRPLKSMNQYYNKKKSHLQGKLSKKKYSSKRINKLSNKRNDKIQDYMHKASKAIVQKLKENDIRCLVIGKNDGWKQETDMNKKNNQNFVSIPHSRFVSLLTYKCEMVGIDVRFTEESYTSKCSFLDLEEMCHHDRYCGRRIKRGMFRSADGTRINADVNGAYNILRKAIPGIFRKGTEGFVVNPRIIAIPN